MKNSTQSWFVPVILVGVDVVVVLNIVVVVEVVVVELVVVVEVVVLVVLTTNGQEPEMKFNKIADF
jgi:hypothetical protein